MEKESSPFELTIDKRFEYLPFALSRIAPYIITEIHQPEKERMLLNIFPKLNPYLVLENAVSPKYLFNFLYEHKSETIIVRDDVFFKTKGYLDIVEGAVCSNPDSASLWPVRYNSLEFTFRGKIVLCTTKTKDEIVAKKRFANFKRDCCFI